MVVHGVKAAAQNVFQYVLRVVLCQSLRKKGHVHEDEAEDPARAGSQVGRGLFIGRPDPGDIPLLEHHAEGQKKIAQEGYEGG